MKTRLFPLFAVTAALPALSPGLHAQTWSAEQQAVLAVVERSWVDDIAEDATWVERMSHPELLSWGSSYPVPRDQAESKRWSEYQDDSSNALIYTLSPVGIAVRGDAAVVHYYATVAEENREGNRRTTVSRCTDTLARAGDTWRYLGWFCFEEPSRDP
jgi:ketosteroid isomerase-like protein